MKTTRKQIEEVLRSEDRTSIFRICKIVKGNCEKHTVHDFIKEYAPTQKLSRKAYGIAYLCCKPINSGIEPLPISRWVRYAISQIGETSNYRKVAMCGHTHLYFASPIYRHSDYNKSRAFKIEGNERLCELLVNITNR